MTEAPPAVASDHSQDRGPAARRSRLAIASQPQPSAWAYDLDEWDNTLYRIRENTDEIHVGDTVHLYVSPTEIYLLKITVGERWPARSGWLGYQKGRQPEPEVEDSGVFFHPSADESLTAQLVYRLYPMLEPGTSITDSQGLEWTFSPPLHFLNQDGEPGEPQWPLTVAADPERSQQLNTIDQAQQLQEWTRHTGVQPDVLSIDWSSYRD